MDTKDSGKWGGTHTGGALSQVQNRRVRDQRVVKALCSAVLKGPKPPLQTTGCVLPFKP